MREIKFRAKSLDTDDWVWGYYIKNDCDIFEDKIYCPDIHLFADIKKETLGQFTGLKDKNGKEVYEGDILIDDEDEIAIVQYSEVDAMFEIIIVDNIVTNFNNESSEWWRIIGNIHDNPELLKESD